MPVVLTLYISPAAKDLNRTGGLNHRFPLYHLQLCRGIHCLFGSIIAIELFSTAIRRRSVLSYPTHGAAIAAPRPQHRPRPAAAPFSAVSVFPPAQSPRLRAVSLLRHLLAISLIGRQSSHWTASGWPCHLSALHLLARDVAATMMIHERSFDRPVASPVSTSTLCTSRDSKSSPFQSATTGGDDASVIEDAGHFEDIGLDDDHAVLKYTPFHGARRASPSPGPRSRPGSSHGPPTRNLAGNGASRPLKPRRSFPNIYANGHAHISDPRSTNLSVLTDPRPLSPSGRRKNCNQSTPALPLLSRRRSPSPAQSLLARDPNIPTKLRRESWQTNSDRKSLVQLEQQVEDDEDDDIPNGLVLDNVPISPRPARDRPPSRTSSRAASASASPERPQKERMRSIGNGTPPVAQAQGSLRSPYWRAIGQTPKAPRSPLKARALSWNAAHLELSPETRDLTEKLEEHAAGLEQIEAWRARRPSATARPNTWDSSRPSADYHFDKKERVKSTPELPPLRRSNIMIDPLPVSKEKEAVLSRTRPSWLPPKDPAEERRHLREYQKMMAASAKADERREAARRTKTECKDSTAESMMSVWEKEVIPRWRDALRETRTREMWWRGIPPRSRGTVWAHALGNDLGLTGASYHAALSRATDLQLRVKEGRGDAEDVRRCNWFGDIRSDVSKKTWTDLRIFQQEGPLHQSLVDVLSAYAMYRSDIGHVCGCNVSLGRVAPA